MPEKRFESEFAFRAGVHVCSSHPFRPFEGGCGAVEGGSNLTERQAVKNAVAVLVVAASAGRDVEFRGREGGSESQSVLVTIWRERASYLPFGEVTAGENGALRLQQVCHLSTKPQLNI